MVEVEGEEATFVSIGAVAERSSALGEARVGGGRFVGRGWEDDELAWMAAETSR